MKRLGFSREEVIGKTSAELQIFPNRELRDAATQSLLREGFVKDFDLPVRSRLGEVLHCITSAEIIADGEQQLLAIVMTDVTQRKATEQALYAMTAHAIQGDRERCFAAGMNDYITKPVTLSAFAQLLTRWLKSTNDSAPASPAPEPHAESRYEAPVFAQAELLDRLMGDRGLAQTVVSAFLSDAPNQLRQLEQVLDHEDPAAVEGFAHRLKGAAATAGAIALSQRAHELEVNSQRCRPAVTRTCVAELTEHFEAFKLELYDSSLFSEKESEQ